jgi:hypothetical protein
MALGTISAWLINQWVGLLFLCFSAFSILIIIRRMMCNSCYYCKSCTSGFAKLSKLFLGGSHIPGIGNGTTLGMSIFIYIILTVIPASLLISSLVQEFSITKIVLLIGILAITSVNVLQKTKNR